MFQIWTNPSLSSPLAPGKKWAVRESLVGPIVSRWRVVSNRKGCNLAGRRGKSMRARRISLRGRAEGTIGNLIPGGISCVNGVLRGRVRILAAGKLGAIQAAIACECAWRSARLGNEKQGKTCRLDKLGGFVQGPGRGVLDVDQDPNF